MAGRVYVKLSFLIPFRDADGTRTRAKEWIVARWRHHYPDAEFVIEPDDGIDPFCKSMAVNAAAKKATGDVFAILDADTWVQTEHVDEGLGIIERTGRWVIPARRSLRLTRDYSEQIMKVKPDESFPRLVSRRSTVEQAGLVAGFLHLVPRHAFEAVGGMDERFRGWGGEDTSFIRALDVVHGKHVQLHGLVISLWHERPRQHGRIWLGQTEAHNVQRNDLGHRYTVAGFRKERMMALLQEPGGPLAA